MKRTLLAPLGALLLSVAALHADPPTLTLPAQIAGTPSAFLAVPATTTGKNVRWLALDEGLNLFPVELLKDSRTAVVSSGTPGTYRLLAVTAAGDEISVPAVCKIVIAGPTPPPPTPGPAPNPPAPAPTPAPTPPPQPVGKAAWAIVVLDNSARTPAIGRLVSSTSLIASLGQRGVTLRVLDVSDPVVKANGYQKSLDAAGGPPALLVFDAKGNKLKIARLPADETSFLAEFPAPAQRAPTRSLGDCPFCPNGQCTYPEQLR
jgi:hypothetical protein